MHVALNFLLLSGKWLTLALQTGASQLSLCCTASLKWDISPRGNISAQVQGEAKGSDITSIVGPACVQTPWRPSVLTKASPAASSLQRQHKDMSPVLRQALTTTSRLRNLYLYPSILWLILSQTHHTSTLLLPALHHDSLVNLHCPHFQSSLPGFSLSALLPVGQSSLGRAQEVCTSKPLSPAHLSAQGTINCRELTWIHKPSL